MRVAKETDRAVDWDAIYAHLRSRLLSIGALKFEELQDKAEVKWKSVVMTAKTDSVAIQHSIDEITKAWQGMREVGFFSETDPEQNRRLMRDLRNKVPLGSPLKLYLGTKEYEANSLDQWVAMVQTFQDLVPKGSKESARVGAEADGSSISDLDAVDAEGLPIGPWSDELTYEQREEEVVRRLNDSMNAARSPYQRPKAKRPSLRGTVSESVLASVPRCRDCGGRHTGRCPNYVAARDSTYNRRNAADAGMYCTFADPSKEGLVCGGMGHLAKHHNHSVAEAAGGSLPKPKGKGKGARIGPKGLSLIHI